MKLPKKCPVLAWLFCGVVVSDGNPLRVKVSESLSMLREKLANDAGITEVIFEEGTYPGGLYVSGPEATDFSKRPLLIRSADGARVLFDGSKRVEQFKPHETLTGVFCKWNL